MFTDYVMNDGHTWSGSGVGETLAGVRFDPGMLRPFFETRNGPLYGQRCVTVNTGRMRYDRDLGMDVPITKTVPVRKLLEAGIEVPVANATTLRKEEWINMDRRVVTATRQRLRAWTDLSAAAGVGGFNGMAKMTHEYEAMTDPGEAQKDMDAIVDARNDAPLFKLRSVPLPITHSDFFFSARRIAVSRNTGTPVDTTMAEAAGRRVAEMVERTLIGTETGVTFGTQTAGVGTHDGTSTEYGYTNFPYRVTKTDLTTPTGSNPESVMRDVIEMRETMYTNGFYGPFILYTSTGYDAFLDDDYFRSGSTAVQRTLRERVESIDGIQAVRRLDFLTSGYQMILVQMDPNVAQAINAMDVTTVQWESQGGMRRNFKVMCIMVPLLKAPYNGTAGIIHATTA